VDRPFPAGKEQRPRARDKAARVFLFRGGRCAQQSQSSGPLGYWACLENRRDKRRQKYQEGPARATAIIRDSVAAGKGLRQALEDVARRGPKAVRKDFEEIVAQRGVGITFAPAGWCGTTSGGPG